jgi:uncharacterized protein (DUF2141 family)
MRCLITLLILGGTASQPGTVQVTVRVLDVRSDKGGVVHAALHRAPGVGFPGPTTDGNVDAAPASPELIVVFRVVPGTYAAAVHHDANANGRMDSNALGIPREGYGVSNDPRPRFRAPRFSEAQVRITRDTTLTLRMAY